MPPPLFKTTITIWSQYEHRGMVDITDLAWEAEQGHDYCSGVSQVLIESPAEDPDWDGTEFFDEEDTNDN